MLGFLKNFFNELSQFRKFLKLNEEQKEILIPYHGSKVSTFLSPIVPKDVMTQTIIRGK